jgi:hypothetical protein
VNEEKRNPTEFPAEPLIDNVRGNRNRPGALWFQPDSRLIAKYPKLRKIDRELREQLSLLYRLDVQIGSKIVSADALLLHIKRLLQIGYTEDEFARHKYHEGEPPQTVVCRSFSGNLDGIVFDTQDVQHYQDGKFANIEAKSWWNFVSLTKLTRQYRDLAKIAINLGRKWGRLGGLTPSSGSAHLSQTEIELGSRYLEVIKSLRQLEMEHSKFLTAPTVCMRQPFGNNLMYNLEPSGQFGGRKIPRRKQVQLIVDFISARINAWDLVARGGRGAGSGKYNGRQRADMISQFKSLQGGIKTVARYFRSSLEKTNSFDKAAAMTTNYVRRKSIRIGRKLLPLLLTELKADPKASRHPAQIAASLLADLHGNTGLKSRLLSGKL